MIGRRHFLRAPLFVASATAAAPAAAQQGRTFRVGLLTPGQRTVADFRRWTLPELAREGFVEGRNLEVVARASDGDPDRLRGLAAEVTAARPDVVVAVSNPAAHALLAAAPGTPIVMGYAGTDPVADGLAESLARPGGPVTGIVMLAKELDVKRVELAREALPTARRLGFLVGATAPARRTVAIVAAAHGLGVELATARAAGPDSFAAAFAALEAGRVEAVVLGSSPAFSANAADLAARALAAGLPLVCEWREMAEAGCLLSLGARNEELRRRTARSASTSSPTCAPPARSASSCRRWSWRAPTG